VRRSLYGSTEDEVLEKLDEHNRRRRLGLGRVDESLTVATYLQAWSDGLMGLRPRTLESYRFTVDRHLIPRLGTLSLLDLQAADIRRVVRSIDDEIGGRTAGYALTILRMALGQAVSDRILERNEAASVRKPATADHSDDPFLDAAAARTFLAAVAGDRLEALYVVAVTLGLRRGEILGLGWRQVDLKAGTLAVTRTLSYLPGDAYDLTPPKTKRARRIVRIPAIAVAALEEHRGRQNRERLAAGTTWRKDWSKAELVFTTKTGGPIAGSTLSHALHRHLAAAGLKRIRFHDLRHSATSMLIEAGVSRPKVQELLGHSDPSMTDRYTHVAPSSSDAADAMDRLLAPPAAAVEGGEP
jgi:integrase